MIEFKLDNKEALRILQNVTKTLKDFKSPLNEVTKMQLKEIEHQYATEGRNILGQGWKALKKATVQARLRSGYGASPILTASGKMRRGHKKLKVTKSEAQVGNKDKNFVFHQLGTKNMAQRQIQGHSTPMIKKALDIVAEYIIKMAKK